VCTERHYVITIMAADRIGLVHDVASRVSALGGDLADIRQQVLRGYLTMILYASFPAEVAPQTIRDALGTLPGGDVGVAVREAAWLPPDQPAGERDDCYVLTAAGADRIGFVATVSRFCKEEGLNILDLATTVHGDRYVMILFVAASIRYCGAPADLSTSVSIEPCFTCHRRTSF